MDQITSPPGLVALGAAALAIVGFIMAAILSVRTSRIRQAQSAVLGDGKRDLVAHAEHLQVAFTELRDWVEESMHRLDRRATEVEDRLDGCLAYHSVVRYDAYGEMSGRQSSSIALLDANRSGVVISTILHRDQARIYVKPVQSGEATFELSPEESQAVESALTAAA